MEFHIGDTVYLKQYNPKMQIADVNENESLCIWEFEGKQVKVTLDNALLTKQNQIEAPLKPYLG